MRGTNLFELLVLRNIVLENSSNRNVHMLSHFDYDLPHHISQRVAGVESF